MTNKPAITVEVDVRASIERVWDCFTKPEHITKWNFASADWHCPSAMIDLRPNGEFRIRMEARDGSQGFDFGGVYNDVKPGQLMTYTLGDGRTVRIDFLQKTGSVHVTETFEAESENSLELQRNGWQAILNNYKKYAEAKVPYVHDESKASTGRDTMTSDE